MHKRRTGVVLLAVTALAVSACGSSTKYANQPKPAIPVNLTVYINDARVSVSPAVVGAGPVAFIVTNQSSRAQSLAISSAGGSQPLASTGPISPDGTAQVSVDFSRPGTYVVGTGNGGATDASLGTPAGIQPGFVHVAAPRPGAGGALLYP